MYEDADYDVGEEHEVYPLEGKERRMVHLAKDFSGSCNDAWLSRNSGRARVGTKRRSSQNACGTDGNDVKSEEAIQQLQTEHQGLRGPTTLLYSRHRILWYHRRSKRQRAIQRQCSTCVEVSI